MFDFDLASPYDLVVEGKRLTVELEAAQNKLLYTQKAFENRDRQYNTASSLVQEMIDDKTITDPEMLKALCNCLDVTASRRVSFSLTIEVSGEMDIPFDEDLDDYGFSLDGISYNGEYVSLDSEDIDVSWDE